MTNQDGNEDAPKVPTDDEVKVNIDEIDSDTASPEQVEALKQHAKTLQAQKKHWRDDAIDPETGKKYKQLIADAKAAPPVSPPNNTPTDETVAKDVAMLKLAEEKRQFGFANQLSPDETDNVFALAQGKGIKPSDAIKDPFFTSGLKALRDQAAAEHATPGVSNRSTMVGDKPFTKLSTDKRRESFNKVVKPI